jgi:hypothetical protein
MESTISPSSEQGSATNSSETACSTKRSSLSFNTLHRLVVGMTPSIPLSPDFANLERRLMSVAADDEIQWPFCLYPVSPKLSSRHARRASAAVQRSERNLIRKINRCLARDGDREDNPARK